jgi:hypothetical protein
MRSDRFAVQDWPSGIYVDDDDFGYDACMKITGDFATKEERIVYAQAVADALNVAEIPTPEKTKEENKTWTPCGHDDPSWCTDDCIPPWKKEGT